MKDHAQRLIIVTGGGTGIGRAIAAAFANNGERVILLGRHSDILVQTATELQQLYSDAIISWRQCDISNAQDIEKFVDWLNSTIGVPVDVLINNAGGTGNLSDMASLAEASAYAHQLLATNLVGTYLMIHALRPFFRRPGSRIINISSIAAVRGGGDMYSAAKAGVIGLTYSLAGDFASDGITVNAIAPGLILDTDFFGDRMTEERLHRTVAQIPLRRPGRPSDIATAAYYLASEDASYVTGEVHHVNGGWFFGR